MQHFVGLWRDYLLPHSEPSPGESSWAWDGCPPTCVCVCVCMWSWSLQKCSSPRHSCTILLLDEDLEVNKSQMPSFLKKKDNSHREKLTRENKKQLASLTTWCVERRPQHIHPGVSYVSVEINVRCEMYKVRCNNTYITSSKSWSASHPLLCLPNQIKCWCFSTEEKDSFPSIISCHLLLKSREGRGTRPLELGKGILP